MITAATRPEGPAADPAIVAAVGDVARPRAPAPFARDLGHLPGKSGILAGLATVYGTIRHGEDHWSRQIAQYGPVFHHMIGPDPFVVVADPELIWSAVRNEDGIWSSALPWTHMFLGLYPGQTGDSLLMLDFQPHKDARRLLQPAFSGPALAGYLDAAQDIYQPVIADWLRAGKVKLKPAVRRLFATVSAKIFMGIDDPAHAALMDRAMTDGWQGLYAMKKRSRWSMSWRRAVRGGTVLWNTFRPLVEGRRRSGGADLFSRICQSQEGTDWLDDDARMRLFINTMFGAFDTTAAGTAAMGALLARHPDWQERVRTEVLAASERPGADEVKALADTELFWKESLRLYPVAGTLVRQSLREVMLGEWRLPAATNVWFLTGAAQRDAKYWTDPMKVDPERFSPARAEDKRHKAIYLPFGAGAHACIGAQIANLEVKAFFHALLRRARLRPLSDAPLRHTYTPIGMLGGDVELAVDPL
jgi:cytochrome P450